MSLNLNNIEFFRFEDTVCYKADDGEIHTLSEESRDIIVLMFEAIESMYVKAYAALKDEYYKRFGWNPKRYQFNVVGRFVRCNFGNIDNVMDVNSKGCFNFERPECPLRGICKHEGVICAPELNTKLGPCEHEVLELLFRGLNNVEIAERLGKSPDTVHNQIFRGYRKLGINEKAQLIDFAHRNHLFKIDE